MTECPFHNVPLSAFVSSLGQGDTPLKVEVSVTPSDEVTALRSDFAAVRSQLAELQRQYNAVEFRYRCEVLRNLQIEDLAKSNGINIPRHLTKRPYDVEVDIMESALEARRTVRAGNAGA